MEVELMVGEGVAGFTHGTVGAGAAALRGFPDFPHRGDGSADSLPEAKSRELQFLFENTRVELDYATPEGATGNQLIFFRFVTRLRVSGAFGYICCRGHQGCFRCTCPLEEMLTGEVYFLRSNPDTTILGPGKCPAGHHSGGIQRRQRLHLSGQRPGIYAGGECEAGFRGARCGGNRRQHLRGWAGYCGETDGGPVRAPHRDVGSVGIYGGCGSTLHGSGIF